MPRQARQKSQSGIYHIILRGINKQILFEEEEDRKKFLECLQHYKTICHCEIYGYCLMDNHVHLLIKESETDIGSFMKRLGVSYVSWYNRKYKRCGHLFQDRFKSEAVETDEYLLTVLRYIHQNPLRAGMAEHLEDFWGSSYMEYVGGCTMVDGDFVLGIFSEEKKEAVDRFKIFMRENSQVKTWLDMPDKIVLTDEHVKGFIEKYANVKTPTALQSMEKMERDEIVRKIKEIPGITTRQIARLTGISQSVIARA